MQEMTSYLKTSSFFILIGLFLLTCKDDDEGTPVDPDVFTSAITNLNVADVGDEQNGTDLEVSFNKISDEKLLSEYRIIVSKSSNIAALTLSAAEGLANDRFTKVAKTGADIKLNLSSGAKDTDGDLVKNGIPYQVAVLSVADGTNANINVLSSPSNEITLTSPPEEVAVDVITNLEVEDVGDNENGTDLQVTFDKVGDESRLEAYRIFVVKSDNATTFNLESAENLSTDLSTLVEKTDNNVSTTLSESATDTDGDLITSNVAYQVFVMSIADGTNANINALSEASDVITLNEPEPEVEVEVTYIANDGIMISDGENKVLIDAVIRAGNLGTAWISPSASALLNVEQGKPPYDGVDAVCITHNHGDHYAINAVQSFLNAHPDAKLLAPPQVRANFPPNPNQMLALNPSQFSKETVVVNDIEITVLYVRHFDQFSYDFSTVENFGYMVNMGGKKFLHLGDIDLSRSMLEDLDLLDEEIEAVFIPTFGTLVNAQNRNALNTNIAPKQVVALHLLVSTMNTTIAQVNTFYPDAIIFTTPFETITF